jgi:hypothetical protein
VLEQAMGRPVRVRVVFDEAAAEAEPARAEAAPAEAEQVSEDEFVARIKQEFDALEVKETR